MTYSLNGCSTEKGRIHIWWREWDGIDRPDHVRSHGEGLHPNEARRLAEQLQRAAEEADKWIELKNSETMKKLRDQKKNIEGEIALLEKSVKNKGA